MFQTLNCIALRSIKYNDRSTILSAYSREAGRMSFIVPSGNGREARRRRALFMPLSVFNCQCDVKPGKEIHMMKEVSPTIMGGSIHSHPVKVVIAMFIADVLNAVLREPQSDPLLYDFIIEAIDNLGRNERGLANFHLCFLFRLGRFLGIEPDIGSHHAGQVFDLIDATFRESPPMHNKYIEVSDAQTVVALSRMTWENLHVFKFTREQRNATLDEILRYYTLHYSRLSDLSSLDVVRTLFT